MKHAHLPTLLLSLCSVVQATDVVTTWDHTGDGLASGNGADATADEHAPATPRGGLDPLFVRFSSDLSQQRNSITALRFDISQMNALLEGQAYELELYDLRYQGTTTQQAAGNRFHLWILTDETQSGWSESAVTWQSGFPGHADDATPYNGPDFTADVTFLQSFTFQASGDQGWSEPIKLNDAAMQTIASLQGPEFTFFVTAGAEAFTQYRFASRENGDAGTGALAPRLSLQEAPVVIEEDFGWTTRGGYGGQVIKVTNLNASGPGSLREALETSGPRIVVFEVGGVIDMGGNFSEPEWLVTEPFLTVAGQTAPSPGITLIRGGIKILTNDVIVQHLRIRPGDAGFAKGSGWEVDALSTSGPNAYSILFDHITATWATDEGMSSSGPRDVEPFETSHNVTFSYCLIAENLEDSAHSKGGHSMGSLIHDHVRGLAIMGCLYASNENRNPYFKAEITGIVANNLIYNPGSIALQYGYIPSQHSSILESSHLTVVGNHYRQGPDSPSGRPLVTITNSSVGDIYLNDNIAETQTGSPLSIISSSSFPQVPEPVVWPDGFEAMPSGETWEYVLANAGARPAESNAIDDRIRDDVRNNTGAVIDSQNEVGGYPSLTPTSHTLTVPVGADAVEAWLRAWSAVWENSSKQAFLSEHFSIAERWKNTISGDTADPEGDGVPNVVEYGLVFDPRAADGQSPFTLDYQLQAEGSLVTIDFRNRIAMAPETITVEAGSDLNTWSDVIPNGVDIIESVVDPDVDGDGRVELKRIEIDQPASGAGFYRIRVE